MSETEHLSKYALKQKRLKEEKNYGIAYELPTEAEKPQPKEKRQTEPKESDDTIEERCMSAGFAKLGDEERERLVQKWTDEIENYKQALALMQAKRDRLTNTMDMFLRNIDRNKKRIEKLRKSR